MARVILNGDPGTVWVNHNSTIQYQLIVSWHNSCGACIQYDHAIGPLWNLPFHNNCRCKQIPIRPGQAAAPFVDYVAKTEELPASERSKVVGAANWSLIRAGVVSWSDVVTGRRVRSLREVIALKGLTPDALVAAGVRRATAAAAHASVNTPAHVLEREERRAAVAKLRALGLTGPQIKRAVAERVAARVGIKSGPSGPGAMPVPAGKPPGGTPRPARVVPVPKPVPAPPVAPAPPQAPPANTPTPTVLKSLGVKPSVAEGLKAPEPPPPALAAAVATIRAAGVRVAPDGYDLLAKLKTADELKRIPAGYLAGSDQIVINQFHPYWREPAARAAQLHAIGWQSTPDAAHPVHHEIGHALHRKALGPDAYKTLKNGTFTRPEDRIAVEKEVSKYAATNYQEFVAETYAGLNSGKTYSPRIMRAFTKLGGVAPAAANPS